MKTTIALCAVLSLASGIAHAGPCSDRIAELDKKLAITDAGSGPTGEAPAAMSHSDAGAPKAGEAPGTGGTAGMNAAVGDRATSPGDVRAQTSGQPTAAQGGSSSTQQISDALARAKKADMAGDATACRRALDDAERLGG